MNQAELTDRLSAAKTPVMDRSGGAAKKFGALLLMAGASMVSGCISVNAPEEPIVIELNINIKQEVIYRLAEDAGNTIEENADIF